MKTRPWWKDGKAERKCGRPDTLRLQPPFPADPPPFLILTQISWFSSRDYALSQFQATRYKPACRPDAFGQAQRSPVSEPCERLHAAPYVPCVPTRVFTSPHVCGSATHTPSTKPRTGRNTYVRDLSCHEGCLCTLGDPGAPSQAEDAGLSVPTVLAGALTFAFHGRVNRTRHLGTLRLSTFLLSHSDKNFSTTCFWDCQGTQSMWGHNTSLLKSSNT